MLIIKGAFYWGEGKGQEVIWSEPEKVSELVVEDDLQRDVIFYKADVYNDDPLAAEFADMSGLLLALLDIQVVLELFFRKEVDALQVGIYVMAGVEGKKGQGSYLEHRQSRCSKILNNTFHIFISGIVEEYKLRCNEQINELEINKKNEKNII